MKSADLKPLHERAAKLSRQLEYFVIEHVPREMNRDADALANLALDGSGAPGIQKESRNDGHGSTESHGRGGKLTESAPAAPSSSKTIRARFLDGVFVPSQTIDLPEGSDVTLVIRKR